jgi:hypothetical protein
MAYRKKRIEIQTIVSVAAPDKYQFSLDVTGFESPPNPGGQEVTKTDF